MSSAYRDKKVGAVSLCVFVPLHLQDTGTSLNTTNSAGGTRNSTDGPRVTLRPLSRQIANGRRLFYLVFRQRSIHGSGFDAEINDDTSIVTQTDVSRRGQEGLFGTLSTMSGSGIGRSAKKVSGTSEDT
jgi:hypothetical protein